MIGIPPLLSLHMCAADKVALVQTMYGTNLHAGSTAGAERIVDGRQVIDDGNGTVRAGLLTLHTADTAVGAVLAGYSTLIVVGAGNDHTSGIVDQLDDVIGTFTGADATADTCLRIHLCHAVFDANGILGADLHAVAVAKAGGGTGAVAVVGKVGCKTGLKALIVVLLLYDVAGAVAGHVGHLFNDVLSLDAEDLCDLLGDAVAAGNTEVGLLC